MTEATIARPRKKPAVPFTNGNSRLNETPEGRSLQFLKAVRALRDGDFSVRLPIGWEGTEGKIAEAFNQALAHQDRITREVSRLSVSVGNEGLLKQRMSV